MSKTKLQGERVGRSLFDEPIHPQIPVSHSPQTLLATFKALDVRLELNGDQLAIDGPRNALDPVLLEAAHTHKTALIEILARESLGHPALDFLADCERRGLKVSTSGPRLEFSPLGIIPQDLRPSLDRNRAAIFAILRLREITAERQRFELWICPCREFWSRYRVACQVCGVRLRFNGRGISARPEKRVPSLQYHPQQQSYI